VVLLLEPPSRLFLGWRREVSPDKRPAFLVVALFLVFQVIHFVPTVGLYFGIITKPPTIYLTALGLVALWFVLIQLLWRFQLLERLLGLPTNGEAGDLRP
jgi:hypothetical protein